MGLEHINLGGHWCFGGVGGHRTLAWEPGGAGPARLWPSCSSLSSVLTFPVAPHPPSAGQPMGRWTQLTPPGCVAVRATAWGTAPSGALTPSPVVWLHSGAHFLGVRCTFSPGLILPRMPLAASHLATPPSLCFPCSVTAKPYFSICPHQPGPGGEVGTSLSGPSHKTPALSRLVLWGWGVQD